MQTTMCPSFKYILYHSIQHSTGICVKFNGSSVGEVRACSHATAISASNPYCTSSIPEADHVLVTKHPERMISDISVTSTWPPI